jgi:hypothetical protein
VLCREKHPLPYEIGFCTNKYEHADETTCDPQNDCHQREGEIKCSNYCYDQMRLKPQHVLLHHTKCTLFFKSSSNISVSFSLLVPHGTHFNPPKRQPRRPGLPPDVDRKLPPEAGSHGPTLMVALTPSPS